MNFTREGKKCILIAFTQYALLGDDIVIADEAVALEYKRIVGVKISESKSLISDNGSIELAMFLNK